jgi:hypothetical protein
MDDHLQNVLSALDARTSLEEALDWDYNIVDYLVGAWGSMSSRTNVKLDKETHIALLAAQLPYTKYEKYQKKLEEWLHNNYNMFVR